MDDIVWLQCGGLLLLGFIFLWTKHVMSTGTLPPGPPAIPLIGHLHLFSKQLPPFVTLSQLSQKYGGYMWLKFGSNPTLVLSSADAAKDVLKTNDLHFASRPQTSYSQAFGYDGADVVFAPYGQYWRDLRKVCTVELFTTKRVEYFRPLRATEMKHFLDDLLESSNKKRVVNMSDTVYNFTVNIILNMIFGRNSALTRDESDPAFKFLVLFKQSGRLASEFHVGDCFPLLKWLDFSLPGMKEVGRGMDEFFQQELDRHKASFDKNHLRDFMDVLISISGSSSLSDRTIRAVTFDMVAGGLETSAVTVEWTMAELARNPEITRKIQEELDTAVPAGEEIVSESYLPNLHYLQAVIKENFRLHPPVPMLVPHLSTTDCKLAAGYQIPKNTQTIINAYAIGRDPSIWKHPLSFIPERMMENNKNVELGTSFELLPFGSGRRICPGMNLGMTTVQFMLANLLYKFDWKTVEPVDVVEANAFTLQRANPLRLVPVARQA